MENPTKEQIGYIKSQWRGKWDGALNAQNQILNWLFAVQGGGLAGTLTYASVQNPTCGICVAVVGFSAGLVLIVSYGARFFYLETHYFKEFKKDAAEFLDMKIDWTQFMARENARPYWYKHCEFLAWSSGIFGLLGLIGLAIAILTGHPKQPIREQFDEATVRVLILARQRPLTPCPAGRWRALPRSC
jgi:hypothetical protein